MEIYNNSRSCWVGVINYNFLPFLLHSPLFSSSQQFHKKKVNKKLMTTDVSIMLIYIKEDLEETEGKHEAYYFRCVLWYTNL